MSITSCLGRNDYNVVFSILILMILTNFYNRTPQVTSKVIIQLFTILSIADIIWIIYFSKAWIQLSDEERAKIGNESGIAEFWDSLWFIHGFVYFLAFIELIIKALLSYYLIVDYKEKYSLKSLFNLSYDDNSDSKSSNIGSDVKKNDINNQISNDLGFGRDTNSFDENFQ